MSSQSDLNTYPWQFVLYYCNTINADPTVYATDLSNVCTLGFDASDNIMISGWLISSYGMPDTKILLTYDLATVLAAYNNFYIIPAAIEVAQPYSISTNKLKGIRADASMIGFSVYDTDTHANKIWNGSTWQTNMQRFLPSTGGVVSGNLGLFTTSFGSGSGVLGIANAAVVPSIIPIDGGIIYVEFGALKYRGPSGIITIIALA